MISLNDYLTANGRYPERAKSPELTPELLNNAKTLLDKVNNFLSEVGITKVSVSSGFRPSAVNASVKGAAVKSNHTKCLAVDLLDPHGDIDAMLLMNVPLLEKYGLYIEDSASTSTWAHIQCVAPKSKNRFFKP